MPKISQNKKIAISAISIFAVSFSVMLLFLGGSQGGVGGKGSASVFHVGGEKTDHTAELVELGNDEPMFLTNGEGMLISVNSMFCELISKSCEHLKGKKLFDLINSKDLPDLVSEFTKLTRDGGKVEAIGPFRFADGGGEKLVILSVETVNGSDNKVSALVFKIKDITKQMKELNEPQEGGWYEKLYPKVKDMDDQDSKLLVEKVV